MYEQKDIVYVFLIAYSENNITIFFYSNIHFYCDINLVFVYFSL